MNYQAPKGIANHPAVAACEHGAASGVDYRHDVWLRDGWRFTAGRMAGCQGGHFNTVQDFIDAAPTPTPALPIR